MALSLDSIYKPVNDFFIDHFKTDAESPIFFKFDKFGIVISDQDFIDPRNPTLGYSPQLAKEKFSDIVNSVPIEDADGKNIYFTQNNIDDTYHDLWLGPSIPFTSEGDDEATKESIVNSFNQIKADAIRDWGNIKLESSTGLMFTFKPSLATPENWYDKNAASGVWTNHSFQVSEKVVTPVDDTPKFQLWRLKADDELLQQIVPVENIQAMAGMDIHRDMVFPKINFALRNAAITKQLVRPQENIAVASNLFRAGVQMREARPLAAEAIQINDHIANRFNTTLVNDLSKDPKPTLRDSLVKSISTLGLKQRTNVINFIKIKSPTQPVSTNSLTITFDYCFVDIARPWLHDSFINNKSWFIPNITKGQLTAHDNTGSSITAMPIGFLAIKNLHIEANWTAQDIANSKNATDFGPFEISFDSISNKLSHEGIQIIGWKLQRLPELPPHNATQ